MNANGKRIKHEQDYINFLERRAKSANFKKNVTPEVYEETKEKLKEAKLILRILQRK